MIASDQNDVATGIRRSVTANNDDWNAAPAIDYFERDLENGQTNTYEESMILDSPYERLVAVNGHLLNPGRTSSTTAKARSSRFPAPIRVGTTEKVRIAKYEQDRNRDHLLMDQLVKAFDSRLLGQTLGPMTFTC